MNQQDLERASREISYFQQTLSEEDRPNLFEILKKGLNDLHELIYKNQLEAAAQSTSVAEFHKSLIIK